MNNYQSIINSVKFSQDGRNIAFSNLYVVILLNLENKKEFIINQTLEPNQFGKVIIVNNYLFYELLLEDGFHHIYQYDIELKKEVDKYCFGYMGFVDISISKDGLYLAYCNFPHSSRNEEGQVNIWNFNKQRNYIPAFFIY